VPLTSAPLPEVLTDPLEGTPYRAVRRLGKGGMGEVWLAEHRQLGRECVAKIMHPHLAKDPDLVDRVRLEAQALGRLRHPHIVSVLGVGGTRDARPFMVMEYLRGKTLQQLLEERGGALSVLESIAYTTQVLVALRAAHEIGLVHRDVKPQNIFICDDPHRGLTIKLLDFGVVRVMPDAPPEAPEPVSLPTGKGVIVGTPAYVSPEAIVGKRADARSDLYSAAVVLYLMLAGRGPFAVRNTEELFEAQAFEDPPPPSHFARTPVPPELDRIVLHGLAKNPDERFQDANEFLRSLLAVADRIRQPQGWAETSTFDLASLSDPAPADPSDFVEPARKDGDETSLAEPPRRSRSSRIVLAAVYILTALLTVAVAAAMLR
jgi:eukaryotic-like serine/threonine-protein kinase